ncbi:MAG: hypothetical protein HGB15_01035 [Chlorobaculum sp.]|nr:hypothetical protein [Chlorobaculum sp.]
MKYISLDNQEDRAYVSGLIRNKGLIPVIGAGFTKGCKTEQGVVPDADEFKDVMIDAIIKCKEQFHDKKIELKKKDFNKISEYYLKYVSRDVVKRQIGERFIGVVLSDVKSRFLSMGWPYIYTLNIDDAIERTGDYKALLPYKKISEHADSFRRVYKLHGCASQEVLYDDLSSLIFSSSQYIKSLIKNKSMLSALKNDYCEKNFIYIGCSLTSEVDLMYTLSEVDDVSLNNNTRIYVTTRRLGDFEEIDLENYGIDRVLLVSDYDEFYSDICDICVESSLDFEDYMKEFLFKEREILAKDIGVNIDYLLRADASLMNKRFVLPYYYVPRSIRSDVLVSIDKYEITVIRGRRFSGKTLFLIDIASAIKDRTVYYIDSSVSLSEDFIVGMLSRSCAVYFIDSNVLDYDMARMIRTKLDVMRKKDIKFVVCCNSFELDVVGVFLVMQDHGFFEIQNKYDQKELLKINEKFSELGVVNWDGRRNILDNIYKYSEYYKERKANVVSLTDLDYDEMRLLVILSVFDKVYSAVVRVMDISLKSVDEMVKKMSPLLEREITSSIEAHKHSGYKVIVNSKLWVAWYANQYYRKNGVERIIKLITDLVKTFDPYGEYHYISKKIVMFDNLNQLFSRDGGAAHVILALYESLQDIMYADPDYWLQRAKAIMKIRAATVGDVLNGIDYAKKAFLDGRRDKTVDNAEFTIALLYGKLCQLMKYGDVLYVAEAIKWFYNAINKQYANKDYIDSMLEASKGRKGYYYYLCEYLRQGITDPKLLSLREEIQFLLNY